MNWLELYDRLSRWLESASRHKEASVSAYLEIVHDTCQQLIDLKPELTDRQRFLQEKVRALYADASLVLGPRLDRDDFAIVIRALASARIFYWIRILDVDPSEDFGSVNELKLLIARRGGPSGGGHSSLEVVERALVAMCGGNPFDRTESAADRLRQACLTDFAELELLRSRWRSHAGS